MNTSHMKSLTDGVWRWVQFGFLMLMCNKPLNSVPLWPYLSPKRRSCVSFSSIEFIKWPTHLRTQLGDASRISTTQMWVVGIYAQSMHQTTADTWRISVSTNDAYCTISFGCRCGNTYMELLPCSSSFFYVFLVKRFSLLRFLYSRGYLNHQKLQGGNLLKCAEAIFTHEIYAGESPP